jgi:hypothetical protein
MSSLDLGYPKRQMFPLDTWLVLDSPTQRGRYWPWHYVLVSVSVIAVKRANIHFDSHTLRDRSYPWHHVLVCHLGKKLAINLVNNILGICHKVMQLETILNMKLMV